MVDKINLSLDDIIKISKKTNKGNRGRGAGRRGRGRGNSRGSGRGVVKGGVGQARNRRGTGRGRGRGKQSSGYTTTKSAPSGKWDHDMFNSGPKKQGLKSAQNRGGNGKLLVSNLDFGVSDSDISELFSEFGAIRRAAVHYDRSGRSLGSADVHFERRQDAAKALQQYNGVPLDGRAMKITFVDGDNSAATTSTPVRGRVGTRGGRGMSRGGRGGSRSGRGGGTKGVSGGGIQKSSRGSSRGRGGRGRGRGGRGRGRGGRQQQKTPTLEELNKQLDEYVSKND